MRNGLYFWVTWKSHDLSVPEFLGSKMRVNMVPAFIGCCEDRTSYQREGDWRLG